MPKLADEEKARLNQFTEPVSGREYAAMQSLFAVISTLQVSEPVLEQRLRKLGGGVWRDFRMLTTKADKVMRALLTTVPVNKLAQISRNFDHTRVYIKVEAPGLKSKDDTNWLYVPASALDYVLNEMLGANCILCDKSEVEGRKCQHRKALEECLPHEIRVARGSERCKFADLIIGLDDIEGVG
jgi:hypothetical protein